MTQKPVIAIGKPKYQHYLDKIKGNSSPPDLFSGLLSPEKQLRHLRFIVYNLDIKRSGEHEELGTAGVGGAEEGC